MDISTLANNAPATACRLLDYKVAGVVPGIVNDTWFLVVSGQAPCMNLEVRLMPLIYVSCPDYWRIELTGCLPGAICLKGIKDFTEVIPLTGVTGSKGIELVGASKSEKIEVSGGCSPGGPV